MIHYQISSPFFGQAEKSANFGKVFLCFCPFWPVISWMKNSCAVTCNADHGAAQAGNYSRMLFS
jgi:hypothetical protein